MKLLPKRRCPTCSTPYRISGAFMCPGGYTEALIPACRCGLTRRLHACERLKRMHGEPYLATYVLWERERRKYLKIEDRNKRIKELLKRGLI